MVTKSTMMPKLRILSSSVMKMEVKVLSFGEPNQNSSWPYSNNKNNNSSSHVDHKRPAGMKNTGLLYLSIIESL